MSTMTRQQIVDAVAAGGNVVWNGTVYNQANILTLPNPLPTDAVATSVDVMEKDYRAIGDGQYHPVSERYKSIEDARAFYPLVQSMNDQLDQLALEKAAANSRFVYMPARNYRLTRALDGANKPSQVFQGEGWQNTILTTESPDIGIDMAGSAKHRLEGFTLQGYGAKTQTGILIQRATNGYTEFCECNGVMVSLAHVPSYNGGKGTVAVYDNAGELYRGTHNHLFADTPLVISGNNVYGIDSPRISRSAPLFTSTSQIGWYGTTFTAFGGPGVLIDGGVGVTLEQGYFTGFNNSYTFAVRLMNSGMRLKLDGHVEPGTVTFTGKVLHVDHMKLEGLDFDVSYYTDGGAAIMMDADAAGGAAAAGITNFRIRGRNMNSGVTHPLIGVDAGGGFNYYALLGGNVHLNADQNIITRGGYATFNVTSEIDASNLTLPGAGFCSVLVNTRRGVQMFGGMNHAYQQSLAYAAAMTPNAAAMNHAVISVTDATAFTINDPSAGAVIGKDFSVTIKNTTAGAIGVATWGTGYKLAGAWVQPGAFSQRTVTFRYSTVGNKWYEISRNAADVAS